tara:strand:+ start:1050 stop:1316 length:267 start_codon:yes stop_codon:yes gene_type:complete
MSKTKEQKVPKWFKGEVYDEGIIVVNRFSGEEYELNALELSIYDMVMGASMISEMNIPDYSNEIVKDLRKGLDWFRKNNPEAYMALLD